jgi:hypothetical protein
MSKKLGSGTPLVEQVDVGVEGELVIAGFACGSIASRAAGR